MYNAKNFYELAGVKRSTVRYYVEQGLLSSADVLENGYAIYSDAQLLDIIMLKSERSLDFGISEIAATRALGVNRRIEELEKRKGMYKRDIDMLQRKIEMIEMYSRILAEMTDKEDKLRIDKQGHRTYETLWINSSMNRGRRETIEEIAHCIEAFPFVRVMLRSTQKMTGNSKEKCIPMEIGYIYEKEKTDFMPLHPDLYETIPARSSILLRTKTYTPLQLEREQLYPIEATMKSKGMRWMGELYAHIHAVERTSKGNLYYITIRAVVESAAEDEADSQKEKADR